ncbi:hypothetical protein [Ralstonia pseudosolanacearum]|uniref:Uncharacterized protein n=1 Tax=Ralstonia solanacearum TaxID=305 RepID=A0ABY6NFM5_RALSL|nr:hypothetical protein LH706_06640 [Ralstonia solanacearum]
MNHNESNTNEIELPSDFKHALVQLCFEFGNEKDVLNVLIKSILEDLREQGFHIRNPKELYELEEGWGFVVGWAETIGETRLAQVFAILATVEENLPQRAFLTDLTKVELTKWSNTEEGVNFDMDVTGVFVSEQ